MNNQLDEGVVNLAKAIRQSESGGNFNATGKSGEHGAYQFTEPTWKTQASKYGIDVPLKEATPEQQNAVAYNKIKEWKDAGHDVTQIASMWNAGEGEPDAYTGKFGSNAGSHKAGDPSIGVNKYGAKYDVPAYAKSVSEAYLKLKNGEDVGSDPNNPSSVGNSSGYKTKTQIGSSVNQDQSQTKEDSNAPGHVISDLSKGNYSGVLQSGIRGLASGLTGGGSEVIGQSLGTGIGQAKEKIKGLLGGKDNSEYYDKSQPSDMDQLKAGGKILASVGSLYGGGQAAGAIKGLLSGEGALESPSVIKAMAKFKMGPEEFSSLSKIEKLNALGESLKTAGLGDSTEIAKAIKYLQPGTGWIKRLAKSGLKEATRFALYNILGNKAGGIVHGVLHE